jgi:carbamoyl-phosphate synthase large subunit
LLCPAGSTWQEVREYRKQLGVLPSFKRIDTCAAEFAADTPYMCVQDALGLGPQGLRAQQGAHLWGF